jgi:hypothetical protein
VTLPFRPGRTVRFPAATCPLQDQGTTSDNGRSVSIHPDEAFLQELRERQATPQGRAKLRERVGRRTWLGKGTGLATAPDAKICSTCVACPNTPHRLRPRYCTGALAPHEEQALQVLMALLTPFGIQQFYIDS